MANVCLIFMCAVFFYHNIHSPSVSIGKFNLFLFIHFNFLFFIILTIIHIIDHIVKTLHIQSNEWNIGRTQEQTKC